MIFKRDEADPKQPTIKLNISAISRLSESIDSQVIATSLSKIFAMFGDVKPNFIFNINS